MMKQTLNKKSKWDMDLWWEERSLPAKIFLGIGFAILGVGFLALLGYVVMILWNWLVPSIIGWKSVNYWQACGLLVLCSILFKGFKFSDEQDNKNRKRKRQLHRYMREECEPVDIASNSKQDNTHESNESPGL